jgi:competence protein ComEA
LFLPNLFSPKKVAVALPTRVTKAKSSQPDSTRQIHEVEKQKNYTLFYFDPNTIDEEGWIKLGVPERTARTIINYRTKGGRFRKPEDVRKIYTLRKEDADRIIPYIRMERPGNGFNNSTRTEYSRKTYSINSIDINTATQEEWKSLPGIGDAYAARIIKFRERLGGFSSINQVAKTYNLPDSTFQKIFPYLKLAKPASNRININNAFENELMECQQMTQDIAKAIVIYRKQHGNYQTVNDLKKIVFLTEEMFQKIAPCLRAE